LTSRIQLVEIGLRWPPEAFLRRKFESLGERGFRVTVVSVLTREQAKAPVRGVTLLRLPSPEDKPLRVLAGVLGNTLVLCVRHPRRLRALLAALRAPLPNQRKPGVREAVARLPAFLPLARLSPDIVHFEWPWRARFYRPLVDVWSAPYVISVRSGHYEVPAHTSEAQSLPELFAAAEAVHSVCSALERAALQHGLDARKSRVIRPAVDAAFFRPADRPETDGRLRVIVVGRMAWYKGHDYALSAIRQLADAGVAVQFDLVGDGPDRARILHSVADLGLEDLVWLHGNVGPAQVRARLREADVLLQSSVAEGIPNSVLEAMACALPVVVTDCGGLREVVTDGIEGFVVARRDPKQMADRLRRLARDPGLRKAMGRAARARIEARFTLDQQADEFADLYHAVLRNG
jgi:colanic acid/amylovoran biosynthesis glycosyltransferase